MAEKMEKRGERSVEKSHFSRTCSLLSQYLKKNGSFGDLALEMSPWSLDQQAKGSSLVSISVSLKPGGDVSGKDHYHNGSKDKNVPNSMELMLYQHSSLNSPVNLTKEESTKPSNSNTKEAGKGQLTIFYGSKVLVFDNFPEDKAKDLMLMASKESTAASAADCTWKNNPMLVPASAGEPVVALQNSPPKPNQANSSDMPIARRNSLHRFLEKRKDRMGKAPYQVVHDGLQEPEAAAKLEENEPWLSLAPQAPKPEGSSQSSRYM